MTAPIHTIGHSNYVLAGLLTLLEHHQVTQIIDIRSIPASKHVPHFNQKRLTKSLQDKEITYIFMGDTLGGRPKNPSLYDKNGRVDYNLIQQTPAFQNALEQLLAEADKKPTAILCSEKGPLYCHRTLLVADALEKRGHDALHITSASECVSHRELIDELVTTFPPPLIGSPDTDLRARAIQLQAAKHAYLRRT